MGTKECSNATKNERSGEGVAGQSLIGCINHKRQWLHANRSLTLERISVMSTAFRWTALSLDSKWNASFTRSASNDPCQNEQTQTFPSLLGDSLVDGQHRCLAPGLQEDVDL